MYHFSILSTCFWNISIESSNFSSTKRTEVNLAMVLRKTGTISFERNISLKEGIVLPNVSNMKKNVQMTFSQIRRLVAMAETVKTRIPNMFFAGFLGKYQMRAYLLMLCVVSV